MSRTVATTSLWAIDLMRRADARLYRSCRRENLLLQEITFLKRGCWKAAGSISIAQLTQTIATSGRSWNAELGHHGRHNTTAVKAAATSDKRWNSKHDLECKTKQCGIFTKAHLRRCLRLSVPSFLTTYLFGEVRDLG